MLWKRLKASQASVAQPKLKSRISLQPAVSMGAQPRESRHNFPWHCERSVAISHDYFEIASALSYLAMAGKGRWLAMTI